MGLELGPEIEAEWAWKLGSQGLHVDRHAGWAPIGARTHTLTEPPDFPTNRGHLGDLVSKTTAEVSNDRVTFGQ